METKNVVLNKYAKDFFGKYLDDDNINEICYQGGNLIWFEDVLGNWGSEESSMDEQKANSFAQAAASFKNLHIAHRRARSSRDPARDLARRRVHHHQKTKQGAL